MKSAQDSESAYYRDSGKVPLASVLSMCVRQSIFRTFMDVMQPGSCTRVLDVGVTSDRRHQESNFFERLYPYPHNITCVGTEDGSHLALEYPGLTYQQVEPGTPLPFAAGDFDVVFSNAVVEHVGSRAEQARFVREICRVGRKFLITTPNRWFPVEHHTGLPLVHFLPARVFRSLLRNTRYHHWSAEAHLNILTARQLATLFPAEADADVRTVWLGPFPANLIASGKGASG